MSPNWVRTGEWCLCDHPDFYLDIDEYQSDGRSMVFCHLTYHNWNKSSLQESLRVFKIFRSCVDCPLYAMGSGKKFDRFVRRFGFKPVTDIPCTDGETRCVYVSFKD